MTHRILLLAALLVASTGCTKALTVLRTVDDVARNLCAIYYADAVGFSIEEAAETVCREEKRLKPFLDEVLAGQQRAGAAQPRVEEDAAQ